MDLKTFFVKVTCLLLLNRATLCLLNRNDPHVCEILVSGGDDNSEAYTVGCCLNYYEENDICQPCRPGKFGRQCSETCIYGYYGSQCKGVCSCTNHERCDSVTGCECIDFTGENCNYRCPEGYHGENCAHVCHCLRGISCDSVTGSCLCPAGLTGPTCSTECSEGFFGENCSFKCSCPTNSVCDGVNGNCSCGIGFTGEACAQRCPYDSFGMNCSKRCNCAKGLSCHPVFGTCQCQNGTMECGDSVTDPNHTDRTSVPFLIIGLSSSGGFVLLFGTAILIVFMFKRNHIQGTVDTRSQDNVIEEVGRPLPDINPYDEINPYNEIPITDIHVVSDDSNIVPYYSYPRIQIRRLSLPNRTAQRGSIAWNDNRGYISLPNINYDETNLNPHYSLPSDIINGRPNLTGQPLERVNGENDGYMYPVHPYTELCRPVDRHEYNDVKSVTVS